MDAVADTHALLWWFTGSRKISPKASQVFEECEKGNCIIFIPIIVMAEALSIFDKKRISFDFLGLLEKLDASDNFILVPLDFPILKDMVNRKDITELHDKIIVSTARHLGLPIITKDSEIQSLSYIQTIW